MTSTPRTSPATTANTAGACSSPSPTSTRPCDARTLLRQIGTDALLAVSARQIVDLGDGVMFRLGAGRTTKLVVRLDASDTYNVTMVKINTRTLDVTTLASLTDVYADMLPDLVRDLNNTL